MRSDRKHMTLLSPAVFALGFLIASLANADTGRHTHPGDEYATILEGTVTGQKENAEATTYSAGESYHNEAGVVRAAKNATNQTVKSVSIFVVEKGKPLIQPVK